MWMFGKVRGRRERGVYTVYRDDRAILQEEISDCDDVTS